MAVRQEAAARGPTLMIKSGEEPYKAQDCRHPPVPAIHL